MTATQPHPTSKAQPDSTSAPDLWVRVLAWSAGVVAAVDVVFFGLIAHVVPPLAVAAVLTVIGLTVLRRRRSLGVGILGVTSLLFLLANTPFAVDHLPHPESGIDWLHAVIGVLGRALAVAAAVAVWRRAGDASGRRVATVSLGLLGAALVVATVATTATGGEQAQADDVVVVVERAAFPAPVEVAAGEVVYVDNRDMFRHTFTVEGTGIDAELPALQGVRVPIDLAPGTYELICAVPGHEAMTAELIVH